MTGYFLYCRKSTEAEDRQVLSIASQIAELKQLTVRLGLPILEVFTESRSAKEPGRPVFNAMMHRIYRGEAQGVICWKLDRLARNPIDGAALIWSLKQQHISIVTPANTYQQQEENTILMYIEFGMAQKYIDDLSKNVTRGLQAKVDQGWLPGVAPLGYLNNRTPAQGARNIIKDPERFPLVRKMWDLMLTGNYTPPQILEMANHEWHFRTRPMRKLGGKPLSRSAIYKIFTNPFYFGLFEYNGQLHQGRHEPMVTAEEFDRVQTLLGRDGRPRRQKHLFAYTGLIRCGECGCAITAENKQKVNKGDGRVHQYTYYRCSKKSRTVKCSQSYIEVRTLERQIDVYLQRIEISEAFKDWAIKYVHEANDQEVAFRKEALATQRRSYDACLKRLDNLMNLKLSPDNTNGTLLSDQEFGEQKSKLVAEKVRLEEKLRDTEQRVEQWLEITEKTFVFACYAREWFAKSDLEKKRQILTVVGSNLVLKDKKLFIEAPKPFFVLEKGLEGKRGEMERFEPPENGSVEPRNEDFNDKNQLWCALVDDVRTSVAQIKDFIDPIECLINSCKISNISQIHSMRS